MIECKIASTISEYNAVYHLRYKIYCSEKKWLNPNSYPSMLEKDAYDSTSVHFMACIDGEIVGAMRLIMGCPLPIEQHPSIHDKISTEGSAEVSRLVFLRSHRKFGNALFLYRAAYQYSLLQKIRNWFIVAEPTLIRAMSMMGFLFRSLGKPVDYFGAVTLPAAIDLKKAYQEFKVKNPVLHSWFNGIEDKERTFDWEKTNSVKWRTEALPYYIQNH